MTPRRGEIWFARLDPIEGHEQGGHRPCLVLSTDFFNSGPAGLVVVLPITWRYKGHLAGLHIPIDPGESGLPDPSWILCDQIRTLDQRRLRRRAGTVSSETLRAAARLLGLLLEIPV